MAERKSVNKYYPPDWDPSKGSVNKYVGQHPLRDRAKKLGQGILVIRFEMPYNIWCGGCNSHIGMGVRYNAEKTKTGMYYTTPIYKFRMKCHLCDNYFEIQTDPKNHDYVILEGARRKEQRWDPKENEQIETEDKAVQKKMVTDPMFKLEHGSDDIQKGKKALHKITSLETRREEWKDDYILNKIAREKFRNEKKAIKTETERDGELLEKSSLDIPLVKETEDDIKLAGLMKYRTVESFDEKQAQKRRDIEFQSFFEPANKLARTEGSKLDIIKKQIRDSKVVKRTNPFDRTKMNTLGGSNISKESLGIKKKSHNLSSYVSTMKVKTHVTSGEDSGNKNNRNGEDTKDKKIAETSRVEEIEYSNEPKVNNSSERLEPKVSNSSERLEPKESNSKERLESSDNKVELETKKESLNTDEAIPESTTSQCQTNTSLENSSLGLVCSYSDTDSDT
ncbi:hypothetical protein ACF0H5_004638 [Mactra antiquata]